MQKMLFIVSCFVGQVCALSALEHDGFIVQENLAQYKGSDYANVVDVARGISLEEAFAIAEKNPDIAYFVYTKGCTMVLEVPKGVSCSDDPFNLVTHENFCYDSGEYASGNCRIFRHGDTVFFGKEGKWLGSAPGLADTYLKKE